MKSRKKVFKPFKRLADSGIDLIRIILGEYRHIFRDPGVLIIFIAASLIYPLLYNALYRNEVLRDVPVAVVDLSQSMRSRELLRRIDATPDLQIAVRCTSLEEARDYFDRQKVHGIVLLPADYSERIHREEQATVSMYSDMSSFMYYRAMVTGVNMAVLDQGTQIRTERLNRDGVAGESAAISADPLPYSSTILFNGSGGFASFLMPAILILIIHQTLFFGIGMQAGTFREENRFHLLIPANRKRSIVQLVSGRSIAYFLLYMVLSVYILGVIPRVFGLPHIGNFTDILAMLIPFLLATIFFSMTCSIFIRNRETGLVIFLFCSLILLFLSGFSWPRSNISPFWLALSWLFPSTPGIQGYLKLNTMGATLGVISREYIGMWIQTCFYFLTTLIVYRWQISGSFRRQQSLDLAQ